MAQLLLLLNFLCTVLELLKLVNYKFNFINSKGGELRRGGQQIHTHINHHINTNLTCAVHKQV